MTKVVRARRGIVRSTVVVLAGAALVGAGTAHGASRGGPIARLVPEVLLASPRSSATPPTTATCRAETAGSVSCYQPSQLRVAYGLDPLFAKGIEGRGETIVIVDAFGSPTIRSDLATFDAAFSIPAPPAFRVLTPTGSIPTYTAKGKDRYSWAIETSLDVEWAHALAPKASIDLVETPTDEVEGTSGFPDIVAAEHYVLTHHLADVISQSFGATEQTFANASQVNGLRSAFVSARADHVTVVSATGDLGATNYEDNAVTIYPYRTSGWPATDPFVTAVGGTKLDLSSSGASLHPAVAWNDTYSHGGSSRPSPSATGGGTSIYFSRPSFQTDVASVTGPHRGVPDISMSAACTGVVDIYVSAAPPSGGSGWKSACGTSEATPLFAAIVALADEEAGHPLGLIDPALYAMRSSSTSGIVAVTSGNNTVAFVSGAKTVTVKGYNATAGYNLATGLGTIDAARFVPALVAEAKKLTAR